MHEEQARIYLRNLLAVARADDVVLLDEHNLLAELSAKRGIRVALLNDCLAELRPAEVKLTALSRFSERVRCLEDMIMLALVDGDVPNSEKQLLFKAAESADISSSNVVTMIREARQRLRQGSTE